MELINFKKYITIRLENLSGLPVYNGNAPLDAEYPFIIYYINATHPDTGRPLTKTYAPLQLEYWDNKNDDSNIINAACKVKSGQDVDGNDTGYIGLHGSFQSETEGFYKCYLDIDTDDILQNEDNTIMKSQKYDIHLG